MEDRAMSGQRVFSQRKALQKEGREVSMNRHRKIYIVLLANACPTLEQRTGIIDMICLRGESLFVRIYRV